MSGCPVVSALNTRTGAPLEKLPSTVDIPTDTAASIDPPMIAPSASAPPPVNSSSALTPCFLKMPARLPISVMEVSQAPRCGTAIFNVSCADAGAAGEQGCGGRREQERNGLHDNHGQSPCMMRSERDRTFIIEQNSDMGSARSLFAFRAGSNAICVISGAESCTRGLCDCRPMRTMTWRRTI